MTNIADFGFPKHMESDELRQRLKFAVQNRRQIDSYIDAVTEELKRRGR